MAAAVESEISGMDELLKNLKELPEKVQKRVLVGAVRAAAKPIVKEARSLAPAKSGALKASIGVTKFETLNKSLVWFQVSPRQHGNFTKRFTTASGQKWSIKGISDPWYAHFTEYGTYSNLDHPLKNKLSAKRKKKRDAIVAKGGGIKPHPFMRPAFEKEGDKAIVALKEYMEKRLDKELAK